jgi:hypothetical protein
MPFHHSFLRRTTSTRVVGAQRHLAFAVSLKRPLGAKRVGRIDFHSRLLLLLLLLLKVRAHL